MPAVHWEYLVQAAEFARVQSVLAPKGYVVAVEDRLMDVTVSTPGGALLWYIEVKEKAADLEALVDGMRMHGRAGVDLSAEDRGRDSLRKAKYLVRYGPTFFSAVAIGMRLDYQVRYAEGNRFELLPDMVPLG